MGIAPDKQHNSDRKRDEEFMSAALVLAEEAFENQEVPIGCIITKGQDIISCGYNCPISSQDPTAHAEIVAIRSAARTLNNYRLLGCKLYVTVEPCAMCVAAIANARIAEVIYGCLAPKTGCIKSNPLSPDATGLNWKFNITGGVLAKEASQLMQDFFSQRRLPKNTGEGL